MPHARPFVLLDQRVKLLHLPAQRLLACPQIPPRPATSPSCAASMYPLQRLCPRPRVG